MVSSPKEQRRNDTASPKRAARGARAGGTTSAAANGPETRADGGGSTGAADTRPKGGGQRRTFSGGLEIDVGALVDKKLTGSGLDAADRTALGIVPLSADQSRARRLFWLDGKPHIAMGIPYFDPWTGEEVLFRGRCLLDPLPEVTVKDGKTGKEKKETLNKYTQPANSPVRAYFPAVGGIDWKAVLADPTTPLIITEGELKAATGTKAGFPTIGLGGVWSFRSAKHGIGFLPELEKVGWSARAVAIAYDSDVVWKDDVKSAMRTLGAELTLRGATVLWIAFPDGGPGKKMGLDDFIVAHGADALRDLMDAAEPVPGWQTLYTVTGKVPDSNLRNASIAVDNAPELMGRFAFDEMTLVVKVIKPLPGETEPFEPRKLQDTDIATVRRWLQGPAGGLTHVSDDAVHKAIMLAAMEHKFHPIRNYLRSVEWDGAPRIDTWMSDYLGAAKTPYTTTMGTMFLISMVARVERPGCKVDHEPVLEGPQGRGKSTALRTLVGEEWFSDNLPPIHGDQKRLPMHLAGKWLIEMPELSSMRRSMVEDVKAFISRQYDKYVPPYGREEKDVARQCVFAGSTNEEAYLKDATGNRRFWPVKVGIIDIEGLSKARDQLWAETFARYRRGEVWWPTLEFEAEHFAPEQNERVEETGYADEIRRVLEAMINAWKKGPDANKAETLLITTSQIMDAVSVPLDRRRGSIGGEFRHVILGEGWVEHSRPKNRARYCHPDATPTAEQKRKALRIRQRGARRVANDDAASATSTGRVNRKY